RSEAQEGDRVGRGWSDEDAGAAASAAVPGQGNARSRARESEGGGGCRQVGGFSQRPRPPVSKKFAQLWMAVTSGLARISFRQGHRRAPAPAPCKISISYRTSMYVRLRTASDSDLTFTA